MSCSPVTIMWHWAIVIMALGNVRYLCRWHYHQYVKNFTTLQSSPRCYLIWCLTITLCLKLQKIDGVLSHYWAKSYVAIFFTAGFFNLGSSVASCVCKFIQYYLKIFFYVILLINNTPLLNYLNDHLIIEYWYISGPALEFKFAVTRYLLSETLK